MHRLRVAAAIPAYQAARSIAEVVARTRPFVERVVVVDDGSTDGTGDRVRGLEARVLSHGVNRGKGSALQTAFDEYMADGFDLVITLDADGQHLPEEIPTLLAAAEEHDADLVLGTRDHLFAAMSTVRRTSNRVSSRLISFAAGQQFSDIQTGFRLYRRRLLESVRLRETGFDAESAILVRAVRRGFRVVPVPVRMGKVDGRATSHYRPVVDSIRIARAVISARFERDR
jgi:glycosyltransferase involved in cell wall biosynthesis